MKTIIEHVAPGRWRWRVDAGRESWAGVTRTRRFARELVRRRAAEMRGAK